MEQIEFNAFEYPYHLTLPVMAPPGVLTGRDRYEGFPNVMEWRTHTHDAGRRRLQQLVLNDPQRRTMRFNLDGGNFVKMLAKMAYGFTILCLNHPFYPSVLDLILSPRDDATLGPYFVGGPFVQPGAAQVPLPTDRSFAFQVRVEKVADSVYVIARIHLFNAFGMPMYDVVVGTATQAVLDAVVDSNAP